MEDISIYSSSKNKETGCSDIEEGVQSHFARTGGLWNWKLKQGVGSKATLKLCCSQPVWGGSSMNMPGHLLEIQNPGLHPRLMINIFILIRFLGDLCVHLFEKQFSKPWFYNAPWMRNNQCYECFQKWSWNECACGGYVLAMVGRSVKSTDTRHIWLFLNKTSLIP